VLSLAAAACSNSPKAAEDRPLKDFSQDIQSETSKLTLKAGATFQISATVKNSGTDIWAANAPNNPVHLSYLWFSDGKQLPIETSRAFLPADLNPGVSQHLIVNGTAPGTPGPYIFKLTMVQERIAWFLAQGAKTFDIAVTVE
jgi:hypothetical protein